MYGGLPVPQLLVENKWTEKASACGAVAFSSDGSLMASSGASRHNSILFRIQCGPMTSHLLFACQAPNCTCTPPIILVIPLRRMRKSGRQIIVDGCAQKLSLPALRDFALSPGPPPHHVCVYNAAQGVTKRYFKGMSTFVKCYYVTECYGFCAFISLQRDIAN
ncbi:Eukaryotic translation initiation factor 2A [Trichuris trichiura]|uniref:Eukaryotic translation initiation factor 2A n=1 Tax=Trichuris trichiura TaxID=36087 RepID=A0A077YXU1_TRITR|nr:Eukaryotic translation initiation factor 2A [Trichuris trichiura]